MFLNVSIISKCLTQTTRRADRDHDAEYDYDAEYDASFCFYDLPLYDIINIFTKE